MRRKASIFTVEQMSFISFEEHRLVYKVISDQMVAAQFKLRTENSKNIYVDYI